MKLFIYHLLLVFSVLLWTGCEEENKQRVTYGNAIDYAPIYNEQILDWLNNELNKEKIELAKLTSKLEEDSENLANKELKDQFNNSKRTVEKLQTRIDRAGYFQFKKREELPEDLNWTSGETQSEIGDSRAKKGGVFTNYITSFPSTLRSFGKESNNSFRGKLYDEIDLSMIGVHSTTSKTIPSLAEEWAVDESTNTVYYRIDPKATFSDGNPVKAEDFITNIYIRVSPFVRDLYAKQYYREQIAGVTTFGDDIVAVTLPESRPRMEQSASIGPASTEFYKNYGPDFEHFYQWKVAPTTGAYSVKDEDIRKGKSVTLTRNKNWWAKDKRYYKNRYNADKISYLVVRDPTKAYELFRIGKIDFFELDDPKYWFEKSEIPPVFNGYIEKYKFFNQYPRVPRGIYMNVIKPALKDVNVRLGIQHSMNWQKIIDSYYRGEFSRLQRFHEGYGEFSNDKITARKFSISKAREYFAKAGFTKLNADGFLERENGEKLSVSITYTKNPNLSRNMSLLKQDAKKVGLDLRLDSLEGTVSYQKVINKEHEMTYWGWGCGPPFPVFYQFFHSSNALDEKGNAKPGTNNINSYASDEMDNYCVATRNARTEGEYLQASLKAQQLIYDEAFFVPSYSINYYSAGCWRWLRWPDSASTPFNAPISDEALSSYVWWIDKDIKKETLEAKRNGETFPEVQKVIDVFKDGIPNAYKIPTE